MKYRLVLALLLLVVMLCAPFMVWNRGALPTANPEEPDEIPVDESPSSRGQDTGRMIDLPGSTASETGSGASSTTEIGEDNPDTYSDLHIDAFKILDEASGEVMDVSVYDYVLGAVMTEMPASFESEALKAQAVASHTYALRHHLNQQESLDPNLKGADFSASPSEYLGFMTMDIARERFGENFDTYHKKISAAVDEVIDEVLVYKGEPIIAAYHAISAGQTEAAENVWQGGADYLIPVESVGDRLSPDYETATLFSTESMRSLLEEAFPGVTLQEDPGQWLEILSRSVSGYIIQARVGDKTSTGLELRNALDLRSSNLEMDYANDTFYFTVFGYGHGVGLSQYGSDYMARHGSDYQEILLHYYQSAEIVRVQ